MSLATRQRTEFLVFDDLKESCSLRAYNAKARAAELDDAAFGLAIQDIGTGTPASVCIRNASAPQMDEATLAEEDSAAKRSYKQYGYRTAINSVLATWALIASLPESDG